jgi:hypothetical protein
VQVPPEQVPCPLQVLPLQGSVGAVWQRSPVNPFTQLQAPAALQLPPFMQLPHESLVPPQAFITVPHLRSPQVGLGQVWHLSPVQSLTQVQVPLPPQVPPFMQLPQSRAGMPQPGSRAPHTRLSPAQVLVVHALAMQVPFTHVVEHGLLQPPQWASSLPVSTHTLLPLTVHSVVPPVQTS